MKRVCIFITVFALIGAALFAGGAKQEPGGPEAAASKIVWAGWSGEEEGSREIFKWMCSNYESKNPGKTVTWVGWPWAETATQLLVRVQGNEQLDIAQADGSILNSIVASGTLADWNDLVSPAWLKDNFDASALEFGNINGRQVGLPWSIASIGLIYNPEILARAGYKEPPKTVAEFERCLEAVAKLSGDIIPYGLSTKDSTASADYLPWLWTFGGRLFDVSGSPSANNPQAVQALTWYKSLIDKKLVRTNMSRFDARQLFAQGRMAFYDDAILAKGILIGNGVPADKIFNVAKPMVRPVLKAGDTPRSTLWGHVLVIFDKSQAKDAAIDYAKYLIDQEVAMKYFEGNGMPPVLKSVIASPAVQNDPWVGNWAQITVTGEMNEYTSRKGGSEIATILSEEIQAVLTGSKAPQKAADDMNTRIKNVK
jgi:multiple sugar transport system substrate-binding protein